MLVRFDSRLQKGHNSSFCDSLPANWVLDEKNYLQKAEAWGVWRLESQSGRTKDHYVLASWSEFDLKMHNQETGHIIDMSMEMTVIN